MGPIAGPIIGGFIGQSSILSWRWTEWIVLIISGALLVSLLLFQPETYEPILLQWKARHLRLLTGDERYIAETEIEHHVRFRNRMVTALKRPFAMTIQEHTIMLWTGYLTVIYLMLFGFLDGYTYIFQQTYNLSQGITGLLFVGIAVGLVFASTTLTPLIFRWARQEIQRSKENSGLGSPSRLSPEFFLWYAMIGAPAIPVSFFWMGWTAFPHISIWSPVLSSVLFGCGILSVFISTYMYLIDTYEIYAASALTMITLVRYVASGGMIEISIPMYRNLGPHWALTLLGLIMSSSQLYHMLFINSGHGSVRKANSQRHKTLMFIIRRSKSVMAMPTYIDHVLISLTFPQIKSTHQLLMSIHGVGVSKMRLIK